MLYNIVIMLDEDSNVEAARTRSSLPLKCASTGPDSLHHARVHIPTEYSGEEWIIEESTLRRDAKFWFVWLVRWGSAERRVKPSVGSCAAQIQKCALSCEVHGLQWRTTARALLFLAALLRNSAFLGSNAVHRQVARTHCRPGFRYRPGTASDRRSREGAQHP